MDFVPFYITGMLGSKYFFLWPGIFYRGRDPGTYTTVKPSLLDKQPVKKSGFPNLNIQYGPNRNGITNVAGYSW